jgi:hypothetical protein
MGPLRNPVLYEEPISTLANSIHTFCTRLTVFQLSRAASAAARRLNAVQNAKFTNTSLRNKHNLKTPSCIESHTPCF